MVHHSLGFRVRSDQGRNLGGRPNVVTTIALLRRFAGAQAPLLQLFLKRGEDSATVSRGRGCSKLDFLKIQMDLSKATVPSRPALVLYAGVNSVDYPAGAATF